MHEKRNSQGELGDPRERVRVRARNNRFNLSRPRKASGRGGKEFVTLNARGNTTAAIVRFHAQHACIAADVDVAGKRYLLRKREDKFD